MSWQNFPGNILLRSVIWFFTKVLEYEVTFCMKWKNAQNCNWLKIDLKWQDGLKSCQLESSVSVAGASDACPCGSSACPGAPDHGLGAFNHGIDAMAAGSGAPNAGQGS